MPLAQGNACDVFHLENTPGQVQKFRRRQITECNNFVLCALIRNIGPVPDYFHTHLVLKTMAKRFFNMSSGSIFVFFSGAPERILFSNSPELYRMYDSFQSSSCIFNVSMNYSFPDSGWFFSGDLPNSSGLYSPVTHDKNVFLNEGRRGDALIARQRHQPGKFA